MELSRIIELAELSHQLKSINDDYADMRCRWVSDPVNTGKDMWWGKDQPYYRFLYLVAKEYSGGVAVEVGTFAGIGFSCLAAGAKASNNPKSWTVGIDKDNHGSAIEVATKYNNCRFINGISTNKEVINKVENICNTTDIKIKIMFIDATHTQNWVNSEIRAYQHLFADPVVIIMDDCFRADNNTRLPECFAELPGQKRLFPGMHVDNCIGVAIIARENFNEWNPVIDPNKLLT